MNKLNLPKESRRTAYGFTGTMEEDKWHKEEKMLRRRPGEPLRSSLRSSAASYGLRRPLQFPYVSVKRLKFGFLKEPPRVKTHGRKFNETHMKQQKDTDRNK